MKQKTILLVDDNRDSRSMYAGVLEHQGYLVVEAKDGREGVLKAKLHAPDLILMDLYLPELTGWEARDTLRQEPELAIIPIVAVTAHPVGGAGAGPGEDDFDGFLVKPCSPRRLVEEVERLIGPASDDNGDGKP